MKKLLVRYVSIFLFGLLVIFGCSTLTPMQKLTNAMNTNDTQLARSAIASGADANEALISVAKANSTNKVEFLLHNGATVDYRPTSYAIKEAAAIDMKTKKVYNINIAGSDAEVMREAKSLVAPLKNNFYYRYVIEGAKGANALHYAIVNRNLSMVELLVNNGANVNETYTTGDQLNRLPISPDLLVMDAKLGQEVHLQGQGFWVSVHEDGYLYSNLLIHTSNEMTPLQDAEITGDAAIIELIRKRVKS